MAFVKEYTRINWQNYTSIATPINATNLNKIDFAVDKIEDFCVEIDTSKADQSELLTCLGDWVDEDDVEHKAVEYNSTTGTFTFNFKNGTQVIADLNIEKIPVSFSMDSSGVITMTTTDGTTYTADVSSMIKTYSFTDSSTIDFTVTTDEEGNKEITADIIDGSITGAKLQPNYLADCNSAKNTAVSASNSASASEVNAENSAEDSEAWAVGTRGGVPVESTDETYHNNAKYYAEQGGGGASALTDLTDVSISNPQNDEVLKYNSTTQKWENRTGGGGSSETVLSATLTAGQTTLTFTDERITANSIVGIAVQHATCSPIDTDDSVEGEITLLFKAQDEDINVKLVVS